MIWLGQASRTPSQLDFFEFFAQTGATIRHFDHDDSAVPDSRDLATLVRLVASDRLHPEIGVVADWTRTASVLRTFASAEFVATRCCGSTTKAGHQ